MKAMRNLANYMAYRASVEGVKWSLTDDWLLSHFNQGIRKFFGVQLDESGRLLSDDQQPHLLQQWKERN